MFPGGPGAAFPSQWTTFGSVTQQGGTGRIQSTTATYAITAVAYLNTVNVADADVVLDVAFATTAEQYATIGLRRNTPTTVGGLSSGYYVQLFPGNGVNSIGINKQVGGGESALSGDLAAGAFTAGVAKRLRFRVVGTSIKVKVWDPAVAEPTTGGPNNDGWLWSGTDSSVTGPGRFAVSMSAGGLPNVQTIVLDSLTLTDGATSTTITAAAALGASFALTATGATVTAAGALTATGAIGVRHALTAAGVSVSSNVPTIAATATAQLRLELAAAGATVSQAAPPSTVAGSNGRNPFRVTIYSKGLAFQQRLGSAVSYSFTPRWTLGTGEVITRTNDPANSLLGQPGARMLVEYRGEVLMSGFVQQETGSVLTTGTITWSLFDDRYLLTFVRARVRPGANVTPTSLSDTAQMTPAPAGHASGRADGSGYYAFPTVATVYPAESAVKQVIRENLARFGSNVAQGKIVVQPDLARGGDARGGGMLPQLRMDTLHDGLLPLLEWANLRLRVWHDGGSSLKLDVDTPQTWTQTIGAGSRIVTDGQYQRTIPAVTRMLLGGPGDDAGRLYWETVDQTGLEATYGIAVEGFTDATGATLTWPDGLEDVARVAMYYLQRSDVAASDKTALQTYLVQAGATALAAGRNTSGLSISLSESPSFHYGGADGYHVGDRITVQVPNGPSITQRITECTLTFSVEGFSVTPVVGDITQDPTTQLARAVAGIAQVVTRLSRT